MTDVFISYKRRLRPQVEIIAAALRALRLEVWFDAKLEAGSSFSGEIAAEARGARCVFVCWSDDAFPHGGDKNGWVLGEATLGRERGVLVSVMVEPTDFDPPWNIIHHESLIGWQPGDGGSNRAGWQGVLAVVGRHVGRPGLADYDRSMAAGSIDALRGWAQAYPEDPLAEEVWQRVEALEMEAVRERLAREKSRPRPEVKADRPPPAGDASRRPAGVAEETVGRPPAAGTPLSLATAATLGGNRTATFLIAGLCALVVVAGVGVWSWGYFDFGRPSLSVQNVDTEQGAVHPALIPAAPVPAASSSDAGTTIASADGTSAKTPKDDQISIASVSPTPPATGALRASTDDSVLDSSEPVPVAMPNTAAGDASGTSSASGQALLLEASTDGTTGAVPFSGTVAWSKGTDQTGQPTLVGKASIPSRNLGVSVTISRNTDPTLPASQLMEIDFTAPDSFAGGSIAGLPGVLMKNEELVQGTPLVGASARVVGNSFLLALSSSAADEATNEDLLASRTWMDLAVVYATGKKAIVTLAVDGEAHQLFGDVLTQWAKEAGLAPAAPK